MEYFVHDGQVFVPEPVQWYRVPHDTEIRNATVSANLSRNDRLYMGDGNYVGQPRDAVINSPENPLQRPMPEVYRLLPDQTTSIPCDYLKLWKNLNPMLSLNKFFSLLDDAFALTNGTGLGDRYNCITGENEGEQPPAFHAPLVMGGALLRGIEVSGALFIRTMLTSDPVPSVEWALENQMWYWGVSITRTGRNNYIMRTGTDGILHPVRIPLLYKRPVSLPLEWLDKLPLGAKPDSALWKPAVG